MANLWWRKFLVIHAKYYVRKITWGIIKIIDKFRKNEYDNKKIYWQIFERK